MSHCELTGKRPQIKYLVSHSNVKTKTWDQPNVQKRRLFSQLLGRFFTLRVAASTVRTLEKRGGLDVFVAGSSEKGMSPRARKVRGLIVRRMAQKKKGAANES